MKTRVLAMMAALVLFSSCNEPQSVEPSPEVYSFSSAINPTTRVSELYFDDDDAISVSAFADEDCSELVLQSVMYESCDRVFRSARPIAYNKDRKLAFRAVYPYAAWRSKAYTYRIDQDQRWYDYYDRSDLMLAKTSLTSSSNPELVFNHCFSHVNINIKADAEIEDAIAGVYSPILVECDHYAGNYVGFGNRVLVLGYNRGGNSFDVVASPQTVEAGDYFVVVKFGGETYSMTLDEELVMASGMQYVVNCTVEATRSGKPSVEWNIEQI